MNKLAILILASSMILAGCSSSDTPETTISSTETLAAPSAADTVTPSPATPSHVTPEGFTTYTDEEQIFSISIPSDWEISDDLSGQDEDWLFTAHLLDGVGNLLSRVRIGVQPWAGEHESLYAAVEPKIEAYRKFPAGKIRVDSFRQIVIDSKEAVLFEFEQLVPMSPPIADYPYLQMQLLENNYVWTLKCESGVGMFDQYREKFYQIVESFRILTEDAVIPTKPEPQPEPIPPI